VIAQHRRHRENGMGPRPQLEDFLVFTSTCDFEDSLGLWLFTKKQISPRMNTDDADLQTN
jgi:hypothetical protein